MHRRSSKASARAGLLAMLFTCALGTTARADATSFDHLYLAPTLHGASSVAHARGGIGADLSINRWLWFEAWASRLSRPYVDGWYPGAWTAGLALNSRASWTRQALVYGAGLVYTTAFQCQRGCTVLSNRLDEQRTALDMYAAQLRIGYQVFVHEAWFLRALATVDLPFTTRKVEHVDSSARYDYHEPPLTFVHFSGVATVGYAFRLD